MQRSLPRAVQSAKASSIRENVLARPKGFEPLTPRFVVSS